jgi:hypothetical protein
MRQSLFLSALALCVCSLPAMADTLFTDLGTANPIYSNSGGWFVAGSGGILSTGYTAANLFTVSGSGSLAVTQVDLAVGNVNGYLNTFYASIWTDSAGLPGAQVAGAYWNSLSTSTAYGACCGLVSITGITGVNLTGGQQYFMILGPLSNSDSSSNVWISNNQSVTGVVLDSNDAGSTWFSQGAGSVLGGFDVLSAATTPEPGTMFMLGGGLLALGFLRKRLHR